MGISIHDGLFSLRTDNKPLVPKSRRVVAERRLALAVTTRDPVDTVASGRIPFHRRAESGRDIGGALRHETELERTSVGFHSGRAATMVRCAARSASLTGEQSALSDALASVTAGPYRPRGSGPGRWRDELNHDRFYNASVYYYTPSGKYGYGLTYSLGEFGGEDYGNVSPSFWLAPSQRFSLSYSYERTDYFGLAQQQILSGSFDITSEQAISGRWFHYERSYYRLAYRRVVARGADAFVVVQHVS